MIEPQAHPKSNQAVPNPQGTAPTQPPIRRPISKKENWRSIFSTVGILLLAPIIAILLTAFVFQSYQVDGPSMETTLYNGDRLVVWKLPRTVARITGHTYIPNRGDVVVFTQPRLSEFGQDPGKQLIKRVIGLPGERVVVKDGYVTVYNSQSPQGFKPDQTLPYGDAIKTTTTDTDIVVPAGNIFVLGDHRSNSLDSRIFGSVDAKNIVGKLAIRVLPLSNIKRF